MSSGVMVIVENPRAINFVLSMLINWLFRKMLLDTFILQYAGENKLLSPLSTK
jgi:hypothetical protein